MNSNELAEMLALIYASIGWGELSTEGGNGNGMAWYWLNIRSIRQIEDSIQIVQGVLVTIFNVYFISCFCLVEEFRNAGTYPFLFQAVIDLFCNGCCCIIEGIVHGSLSLGFIVSDDLETHLVSCFCTFANILVSTWATPLTMTLVAITRYIMVCRPIFAKEKLFLKLQIWGNILITSLFAVLFLANGTYIWFFVRWAVVPEYCDKSFYPSERVKAIVDGLIFFFVPATVCSILYMLVGKTLWQMTAMQRRNRQLTILFASSCVMWIIFWLPEKLFFLIIPPHTDLDETVAYWDRGIMFFLFYHYCKNISRLFSIFQPIVLVLSYRPLFNPLLVLFKKEEVQ